MRNVINKADDSGALELVDGQDVREHWDAFFRIRFRKLYFEDTQIIIYLYRWLFVVILLPTKHIPIPGIENFKEF